MNPYLCSYFGVSLYRLDLIEQLAKAVSASPAKRWTPIAIPSEGNSVAQAAWTASASALKFC